MNKIQIKKINRAKTWFIESDKFTLDYRVSNMFDGHAKNDIIDAYEYLLSSFKKDETFKKVIDIYEERTFEIKQDYIDLCYAIKNFVNNINESSHIKYSKETLDFIASHSSYGKIDEDEIFKEIEELEAKEEHIKAANLLSVYVNFAMSKNRKILITKSRKCVSVLINAGLINFEDLGDDKVYISRKPTTGIQGAHNYTL